MAVPKIVVPMRRDGRYPETIPYGAGTSRWSDGNLYGISALDVTLAELDDFLDRHMGDPWTEWSALWTAEGWPQPLRVSFTAKEDIPPPDPQYTPDGRLRPLGFNRLGSHVKPVREKP